MYKVLKNLLLFLGNTIFYIYVFSVFSSTASDLLFSSLVNFSNDLSSIGFPFTDSVSSNFVVFFISLLNTIFIASFIKLDFHNSKIEKILLEFTKLFLINAGVFTFSLYILRLFNLPRSILIISMLAYPFVISFVTYIISIFNRVKLSKNKSLVFLGILTITGLFYALTFIDFNSTQVTIEKKDSAGSDSIINFEIVESSTDNSLTCNPWSGSENYISCLYGIEITEEFNFELQVNNISNFGDKSYLIVENGRVLEYENGNYSEFLNIEEKVFFKDGGEEGLFDIAFHPSGDYFLISFTNLKNGLEVDKYQIINGDISFQSVLVDIPNNQCCHFAGSLDWSEYFNGFLLSIGDMEANNASVLNSESLNTTSPRGKVILLEAEDKIYAPNISSNGSYDPLTNIVAFGLRNPWQMIEHDDSIIIPDVGNQNIEELNVIPYSSFSNGCEIGINIIENGGSEECSFMTPVSLGWPIYEGPFYSKELNKNTGGDLLLDEKNVTELYLWYDTIETGNYVKADPFLIQSSKAPSVYYNHRPGNNIYRAAIIGGDVITNPESYYNNYYFFTDYVTLELFAYNLEENKLYLFPVNNIYNTNPTSLRVHPSKKDTLMVGLKSGQILNIKLPEIPRLELDN